MPKPVSKKLDSFNVSKQEAVEPFPDDWIDDWEEKEDSLSVNLPKLKDNELEPVNLPKLKDNELEPVDLSNLKDNELEPVDLPNLKDNELEPFDLSNLEDNELEPFDLSNFEDNEVEPEPYNQPESDVELWMIEEASAEIETLANNNNSDSKPSYNFKGFRRLNSSVNLDEVEAKKTDAGEDLINPPLSFEELEQSSRKSSSSQLPEFPGTPRTRVRNENLLARVLEGRSHEEKTKILQIAYAVDLKKDDPLWSVLLSTGILEALLNEKPAEIEKIFQQWSQQWQSHLSDAASLFDAEQRRLRAFVRGLDQYLERQTKSALDVQAQNVSDMASVMVRQAAFKKVGHDLAALIWGGSYLLIALSIGVFLGVIFKQQPLDPSGPRQLTLKEAQGLAWAQSNLGSQARENPELVQWALSSQGRWARQFMQWNEALLLSKGQRRVCEQDAIYMGITLTLDGRVAKGGFCTLWTRPPNQRQFAK